MWFDNQAEEAARFYVSLFKDSKIVNISYYPKAAEEVAEKPEGSVMTVEFELNGQRFLALNGGPLFKFSEAISFMIDCEDQAEVDEYWSKLTEGGEESQCGWLKDKYGLSWQVVPRGLAEIMNNPDPLKANRAMQAMLSMKKLDIQALQDAAEKE